MNQNAIVIYNSRTGFTERYARWISGELGCESVSYEKRKSLDLSAYDIIIYGGGFTAGTINGLKWLKSRLPQLAGKTILVFATGGMPASASESSRTLRKNFTDQEWQAVRAFYFPGGLCYEKMRPAGRLMMSMFRKMLKRSEGESETWRMLGQSYDLTSKAFIRPLLECCRR